MMGSEALIDSSSGAVIQALSEVYDRRDERIDAFETKALSDELAAKSNSLTDVPHFFPFLDTEREEFAYVANLGDA